MTIDWAIYMEGSVLLRDLWDNDYAQGKVHKDYTCSLLEIMPQPMLVCCMLKGMEYKEYMRSMGLKYMLQNQV